MMKSKNRSSASFAICGWAMAFLLSTVLSTVLTGCSNGSSGGGVAQPLATVSPGAAGTPGASLSDPTVGSASPSQGATSVPTSTNDKDNIQSGTEVTITFTQPMDPDTLESSPAGTLPTFTVRESGGAGVPGTVAMNVTGTTATFTPTAGALTADTMYIVSVSTAARNSAGKAMASPVSWSFTTSTTAFVGQTPVELGHAGDFAIFANSGIANSTVPATIKGDMGVGPGVTSTAITGPWGLVLPVDGTFASSAQVTGNVYAFDYADPTPAEVTTASADMETGYDDAAGRLLPDFLNIHGGQLAGKTLTRGLYRWAGAVVLAAGGNVTLSGGKDDVWILQVTGALTPGAASRVLLSGGARAKNVFWQVGGTVTLGANAHFEGIILANGAINFGNRASAKSRLLAQTAVNLDQNTVTEPSTSGTPSLTPAVTVSNPPSGAVEVPTSVNGKNNVETPTVVTANFSQPMDSSTIDSSPAGTQLTFTLKTAAGANVPGTVAMNAARTMATFTPTAASLSPNTQYTATVTIAATNADGVALANPVVWTFTTKNSSVAGQAPVDLGRAGDYVIFANTGIDNATVPAAITGDMGVGPGVTSTAITGWVLDLPAASAFSTSSQVSGKIYAFDYAAPTPTQVTTASTDMGTAYTDAAGRLLPDFLNLASGDLTGLTLTPGLYTWGSDVTLLTGDVTLSGGANDVWIFQIAGTVETGADTNVFLSGGARPENIFWQVAGSTVTLGANAHFEGVVLAQVAITFGNQATANGRLLAQAAVNLDQSVVTQPE